MAPVPVETRRVDQQIDALAYESTARGEALATFAHRFHTWSPDDPRWARFHDLLAVAEYGHEYDTAQAGEEIGRPGRIAAASLELLDIAGLLTSDRDHVSAGVLGEVVRSAKIIESEALAFLSEAGARYSEATR
jgi:hypothetical protein